jgi:hypothetical protein
MKTIKMKILAVSLLAAMGLASNAWAVAGNQTPNSTTKTVHVNFLFDGSCYQNAFDSRYSWTSWYNSYAQANTNSRIWGYLNTVFNGDVTFKITRHGNNGAVYQVDLTSTLANASYTYGYSYNDINSYSYNSTSDWWGVSANATASSYGNAYASSEGSSSASSDTTVFTKGANITEFKAHIALNAGRFSNIYASNYAGAWSQASTNAGWPSNAGSSAYAEAWADLLSQSSVYMDITAHYQKKPGTNSDVETVVDNVTGYLSCGANNGMYASTYAYAY